MVFEVDSTECAKVAASSASGNHYQRNIWLEFECSARVEGRSLKIKAMDINFCGLKVFGTSANPSVNGVPKNGVSIDVDSQGNPTVVTVKDEIYQLKANVWNKLLQTGSDAAVSPDDKLWKLSSDSSELLAYDNSSQTWRTKAQVP